MLLKDWQKLLKVKSSNVKEKRIRMVTIEEIKAGISEKSIERAEAVKKFRAEVEKKRNEIGKKRKELEEERKKYRAKFYPKSKKEK